jgi:hypothetical protein
MSLPKQIKMETGATKRDVPVFTLGAVGTPTHPNPNYEQYLQNGSDWDGHTKASVPEFLRTWILPDKVRELKEELERVLEEGVPDQKRSVRWNQDAGTLDDRFITDIALGEEVENPFWSWSRTNSDTVRVAICMDSCTCWWMSPELLKARMIVAAALTAAFEALDYECLTVAAHLLGSGDVGAKPREDTKTRCVATVMKEDNEPLVDSGFAHYSDTGIRRLMNCWITDGNPCATQLTNDEWRALADADLYIYIGEWGGARAVINTKGKPSDSPIGPKGEDALRLRVSSMKDVEPARIALEDFFRGQEDV